MNLGEMLYRTAAVLQRTLRHGVATGGGATTLVDDNLNEPADYFDGGTLFFRSGPMAGRTVVISDWSGSAHTFTFTSPNLLAASDPSFEAGVGGWLANGVGWSVAASAAQKVFGAQSLGITPPAGAVPGGAYRNINLIAGVPYVFSAHVRDVADLLFSFSITDGSDLSSTVWTGTGAWARHEVTHTPAQSKSYGLNLYRSTPTDANPIYMDGVQLEMGSVALPFFEISAGQHYAALSKMYSRESLVAAVNQALKALGPFSMKDDTTTVVAQTERYALPAGVGRVLQVQIELEAGLYSQPYQSWEETGGYLYIDPGDYGLLDNLAGLHLRLWSEGEHPQVFLDADPINADIAPELLATAAAWQAATNKIAAGPSPSQNAGVDASLASALEQAQHRYPIQRLRRTIKLRGD